MYIVHFTYDVVDQAHTLYLLDQGTCLIQYFTALLTYRVKLDMTELNDICQSFKGKCIFRDTEP